MGKRRSNPELKFNSKIYREEAIRKAISDYASLAKFEVKNDKNYIKVKIKDIDPTVKDVITDEFANYVLGMCKKCL